MSFKKILVAVNSSSQAKMVFAQALELAKKEPASFAIFHCIELEAKYSILSEIEVKTEQAQGLLRSYHQAAKEQGISAEINYQSGEPGLLICELAKSWRADLIVVGRRGYRGISEVLLGSVSNYVIHHAPCSVLVVQGEAIGS